MQNWISLWPTLKRLLTYLQPHQKSLILAILLLWIASVAEVTGPIVISYFIDYILPEKKISLKIITELVVVFVMLQILSAALCYNHALLFNRTALRVIQQLRIEAMDAALRQPLSVFDEQPVGQLISRVTNDTEVVKDLYIMVITSILRSMVLIGTMLISMFLLEWRLACISLALFPIVIIVMWLYQHYSTPIVRQQRSYIADINDSFVEAINGMEVIQQFRQQRRFGDKLQLASYAHLQARMATLRLEGYLLRPMLSLLFSLILCGILLLFSLSSVGSIGVGILYAFINYLGRLNEPLIELTSRQTIMQQAAAAGERIFELIDRPEQHYGSDDRLLRRGSITLNNLKFSYSYNGTPVLRQVSLTIPSKSFFALVGHTGSGKSTLASLIMGHYPVEKGMLFLDERPIETLTHRVLRQGIAMVQQDPIVIADTVYANITLGRKISESQVWNALEQVKLAKLVHTLPGGLYAELGEQGNTLSVGQKQLLSLARVLVFTPVILILDEATANIDSGTEKAIASTLQAVRQHTTLLVIAHRLSTIVDADQILVLHRGEAVEQGTHASLLESRGHYYQMYQLQQVGQTLHI
ncbi:SmdB family multidrug efflux ABC transporter permease/ATP-binding protein [Sodalis sp. CWE]|uniref:SmdB family multidrug efflux ABC transporter permease/ATP-binding protein n=1 Tax=Sodalis sp. CWE TaxID=2803816 RepID=UPI001C7D0929|nr:SmdB family multidrug efflux ABC transporter permease/ATP-binding protein [Sodalis sp. CWE]MBX4181191.1 SmdB family multidrug efflux ABC transporter permease/ATP-binding protein [Sodalis sp. CWE]